MTGVQTCALPIYLDHENPVIANARVPAGNVEAAAAAAEAAPAEAPKEEKK